MQPRWYEGIYLGSRFETGEHYVGLADGRVVRTGAVELLPVESMWSAAKLLAIQCFPGAPTTTLRRHNFPVPGVRDGQLPAGPEPPEPVNYDMPVQLKHLEKYGFTDKCWKCRHMRDGDASAEVKARSHSIACRSRIRSHALQDPEFRDQAEAARRRMGQESVPPPVVEAPVESGQTPASGSSSSSSGAVQPNADQQPMVDSRAPIPMAGEDAQHADGDGEIPVPMLDEIPRDAEPHRAAAGPLEEEEPEGKRRRLQAIHSKRSEEVRFLGAMGV